MTRMPNMYNAAVVLLSLLLVGCAAPAYRPPEVAVPAAFRETPDSVPPAAVDAARPEPGERTPVSGAEATDTLLPVEAAWLGLGDTTLTRLIREVVGANLDVRAAEARVLGAPIGRA